MLGGKSMTNVYLTTIRNERVVRELQQFQPLNMNLDGLFDTGLNIKKEEQEPIITEEVTYHTDSSQTYTKVLTLNGLYQLIGDGKISFPNYESVVPLLRGDSPILTMSEEEKKGMYDFFQIPKRTGGLRPIKAPKPQLKEVQNSYRHIFEHVLKMLPHNNAYAYIKGRSVHHALAVHQQNESKWFLKLDLKNFFDNCTPEFISTQLRKLHPLAGWTQTEYLSFIEKVVKVGCLDNGLPQGTPLSPTLTNLSMVEFDKWMTDYAYRNALRYTRYADDLLISSKYSFRFAPVVDAIKAFMGEKNYPFTINDEKTHYGSSAGSNFNLGLMLNKDNVITIGHRNKKELKNQMFFLFKNKEQWDTMDVLRLRGQLEWLRSNEPETHASLINWFNRKHNCNIYGIINSILNP